jgi:hypothetical protein
MRSVKLAFPLFHYSSFNDCISEMAGFQASSLLKCNLPPTSITLDRWVVQVNETILKSLVTYPDQDYFYQPDYSQLTASLSNILSSSCRQVQQCPAPTTTPPPPREI